MPYEQVEVRTPVAGNVLSIHFEEGQTVEKGQLLVSIDSRVWKAQREGLKAQLTAAENELERKRKLLTVEGASEEDVDQVKSRVESFRSQINELSVRIDLAEVRAPFSGRLGMRDFSTGAYLAQGAAITHLVQENRLKVNFDIPARFARLFQTGDSVNMVNKTLSDTIVAQIYAIDPSINRETRTLTMRATVDNSDLALVPGDFVTVFARLKLRNDALVVPAEAVIPELNSQVVYIANNGVARKTTIEAGKRSENMVFALSGISPGDTIITTGLMQIREGSQIQVNKINTEVRP